MAHSHRLMLALGLLLTLSAVSGWGVALAATPISGFGDEPRSGLIVTRVGPTGDEQLMPGGGYRELFAISVQVNSAYDFALHLSSRELAMGFVSVAIADSAGHMLYAGPATAAAFDGRSLTAGQTDWLTVRIFGALGGDWLVPGATVKQTWTVTAQPD